MAEQSFSLKPFQQEAVEKVCKMLESRNKIILSFEMGMGKTVVTIASAIETFNASKDESFKVFICAHHENGVRTYKKDIESVTKLYNGLNYGVHILTKKGGYQSWKDPIPVVKSSGKRRIDFYITTNTNLLMLASKSNKGESVPIEKMTMASMFALKAKQEGDESSRVDAILDECKKVHSVYHRVIFDEFHRYKKYIEKVSELITPQYGTIFVSATPYNGKNMSSIRKLISGDTSLNGEIYDISFRLIQGIFENNSNETETTEYNEDIRYLQRMKSAYQTGWNKTFNYTKRFTEIEDFPGRLRVNITIPLSDLETLCYNSVNGTSNQAKADKKKDKTTADDKLKTMQEICQSVRVIGTTGSTEMFEYAETTGVKLNDYNIRNIGNYLEDLDFLMGSDGEIKTEINNTIKENIKGFNKELYAKLMTPTVDIETIHVGIGVKSLDLSAIPKVTKKSDDKKAHLAAYVEYLKNNSARLKRFMAYTKKISEIKTEGKSTLIEVLKGLEIGTSIQGYKETLLYCLIRRFLADVKRRQYKQHKILVSGFSRASLAMARAVLHRLERDASHDYTLVRQGSSIVDSLKNHKRCFTYKTFENADTIQEDMQNLDDLAVCLASAGQISTSISLHHKCFVMIKLDKNDKLYEDEQLDGRITRIGQEHLPIILYLSGDTPIDDIKNKRIERKWKLVDDFNMIDDAISTAEAELEEDDDSKELIAKMNRKAREAVADKYKRRIRDKTMKPDVRALLEAKSKWIVNALDDTEVIDYEVKVSYMPRNK